MRPFLSFVALSLCAAALGQSELIGPGRFPETRGLSALPGGGFGVTRDGRPSFGGAIALSTPIAYGLDDWHWAFGLSSTSYDMRLRWVDTDREGTESGGTGFVMAGIPTRWGSFTYSVMFISVHLKEMTTNIHFTPKQNGEITYAVGVQDLFDTSGTFRPREPRSATSPYVVATGSPLPGWHASLGYGNQRFGGVFGNVSAPVNRWAKALAEYDTYNWNYGAAFRLGELGPESRPVEATMFLGFVRGKYATWSLAFSF